MGETRSPGFPGKGVRRLPKRVFFLSGRTEFGRNVGRRGKLNVGALNGES